MFSTQVPKEEYVPSVPGLPRVKAGVAHILLPRPRKQRENGAPFTWESPDKQPQREQGGPPVQTTPGTGRSHIPQGTFYDANEDLFTLKY